MKPIALSVFLAILLLSTAHAKTFEDYECTDDCSGHEAGYEWASKQDITDADDCEGRSNSFSEGCIAYVDDNPEEDDDSATGNDDSDYRR